MLGKNKELVNKLAECIHICNDCMNACLEEEDVKMMADCIRYDKECSEICALTLQLVHKGGRFIREALQMAKNACQVCAEECRKFQNDHCQRCAEACEACAQECENKLNFHKDDQNIMQNFC